MLRGMFVALAIFSAGCIANAQSGLITLIKNPPVREFWDETKRGSNACTLVRLTYWGEVQLTKYGSGDPTAAYGKVLSCVYEKKEEPRSKLIAALKYLEGRPGASKALKDFYLKWSSYLESNTPTTGETFPAQEARLNAAEQAVKESQKSLELELELTTVRLKVEQNQLLSVVGLFGCGLIGPEGA